MSLRAYKMLLLAAALLMTSMSLPSKTYASLQTVRVGLTRFHEVTSIPITDRSVIIGFNNNGSFTQIIAKNTTSGFVVTIPSGYFAQVSGGFSSYAEAQMQGAGTVLFNGSNFTLLSGPFQTREEALSLGELYVPSAQSVLLIADNIPAIVFDAGSLMQIAPASGEDSVSVGDRRYRGIIEFGRFRGRNLTAVNIVPLEQYLFSVVPSEMPASWHMNALKAQAIAARSYSINRAGVHSAEGFDLCDTTHCQVYIGRGNEHARTTDAVNQTAGRFAFWGEQIINATYFSSSGGVTDNSENVWINPTPYLISVVETNETEFLNWQRTFSMQELTNLAGNIGQVSSVTVTHQSNGRVGQLVLNGAGGSRILQREEIRTFFSGTSEGSLPSRNFYIAGTNPQTSQQVQAATHAGNIPISIRAAEGEAVNALAGGIYVLGRTGNAATHSGLTVIGQNATVSYGALPAGQAPNLGGGTAESTGNSVAFTGRGFGHGVGMSQFGARGMAEAGFTYREIIAFYYNGAVVR